jgi:acyl transferase domain-containing protein/3-hydroxymyristoyl/3-hydroxydecanoyl-(acyl carrier protein) dehydratase
VVVPGARDPGTLWRNVLQNLVFFREASNSDFGADPGPFLSPGEPAPDKACSLTGSWLSDRPADLGDLRLPGSFDPAEADPSLLFWLAAARAALPASLLRGHDPAAAGVVAGHVVLPTRAMAEATVSLYGREITRGWETNPFAPPPKTNPFRAVGYSAKLAAEALGLAGPAFTVDAACASSLYALRLALDRLRDGSLTLALTGGLAQADPLFTQLGFTQLRALSKSGVPRPFDSRADGLVVGSGAVALALKRLDRALADGDRVMAVVSGVGLGNDRRGSLLAPDSAGQERAMRKAFWEAGLPGDLAPGLVEAHGTSTPLGDAAEMGAVKRFLAGRSCGFAPVVGSVKGNVGHLLSAAGAVALAKAALALEHETLPPTAGYESPAPGLDLDSEPRVRILTEPLPWPEPARGRPRVAAVNAFGFGGVNAQAVLEEYRAEGWRILGAKPPARAPYEFKSWEFRGLAPGGGAGDAGDEGAGAAEISAPAGEGPLKTPAAGPAPADSAGADDIFPAAGRGADDDAAPARETSAGADVSGGNNNNNNNIDDDVAGAGPGGAGLPSPAPGRGPGTAAYLISARTVLAPWPTYDALARYWLTPEEPPLAETRRFGGLKATGFFFDRLTLDVKNFRLPPRELAEALPQQTLAFKAGLAALAAAGLDPEHWPESLDRDRVGVFMGVEIDPRSADYALRWLAPNRAVARLVERGLPEAEAPALMEKMLAGCPPALTRGRVLGALGSFVASRLARHLGAGGPAFTMSEEQDSGLRALREAINMLAAGEVDLALVGVVDTFGDPKTAALAPRTVWAEGAAALVLASPRAAASLRPLAELTLSESGSRLGPLSGLFALNRSGFYLRHHLRPLGRGHGFAYWLRNPQDPPRSLEGPGYRLSETPGARPQPLTVPSDPARPDVWFLFRAESDGRLAEDLLDLAAHAEQNPGKDALALLRHHLSRPAAGRPRLAILARDARELLQHLKKALSPDPDAGRDHKPRVLMAPEKPLAGRLAWVFPGSGAHYKGLGRGLAVSFPEVVSQLEVQTENPVALFQSKLFWEPNHKRPGVREAILGQVCFGLIGARVLDKMDIRPDAVMGYSLGEVSALVASGIWGDWDELHRDLAASTLFNQDLCGELAAPRQYWNWPAHKGLRWVSAVLPRPAEIVRPAIEGLLPPHRHRAFVLIVNTRDEVVVGGEETAVQTLAQALEAPLFPVEDVAAVHAPTVGPVLEKYRRFHTRTVYPKTGLDYYSCFNAAVTPQTSEAAAESLAAQALRGHDFPELVERAYADGTRFFVEVGPGNSTTRMIRSILGGRPHLAQSLAASAVDEGWTGLNRLIAELWLAGYPVSPERCMLQPAPEPDLRYQVPVSLAAPEVEWPRPDVACAPAGETAAAGPPEDYLTWLEQQTGSARRRAGTAAGKAADDAGPDAMAGPEATPPAGPMAGPAAGPGATPPAGPPSSFSPPSPDSPGPPGTDAAGVAGPAVGPEAAAGPPSSFSSPDTPGTGGRADAAGAAFGGPVREILTRADLLEFATGSIEKALGPEFAEADAFPSRVRLPAEPLMFADRVTLLEGDAKSLAGGRLVTEHDIRPDEWCLEDGRMTPGMTIEAGQADLLLSAWLGADFSTRGLARYRLLDAEVVFHSPLPRAGETSAYDIRINNFFSHADTLMFRFEFEGSVAGAPLLSMRRGCAGFFTERALAAGKGLGRSTPAPRPEDAGGPGGPAAPPRATFLGPFAGQGPSVLDDAQVAALRSGDPTPLGGAFARAASGGPVLLLPGGMLTLFHRCVTLDLQGGVHGRGLIRCQADVDPEAWYLASHFQGDEVMPGTLMYDGCLQALRLLLLARGWLGPAGTASFQPYLGVPQTLRCRGQVTPATRTVTYEVHLRQASLGPAGTDGGRPDAPESFDTAEPHALADAVMLADDKPVVEAAGLGLRLAGVTAQDLAALWPDAARKPGRGRKTVVITQTRRPRQRPADGPPPYNPESRPRGPESRGEPGGRFGGGGGRSQSGDAPRSGWGSDQGRPGGWPSSQNRSGTAGPWGRPDPTRESSRPFPGGGGDDDQAAATTAGRATTTAPAGTAATPEISPERARPGTPAEAGPESAARAAEPSAGADVSRASGTPDAGAAPGASGTTRSSGASGTFKTTEAAGAGPPVPETSATTTPRVMETWRDAPEEERDGPAPEPQIPEEPPRRRPGRPRKNPPAADGPATAPRTAGGARKTAAGETEKTRPPDAGGTAGDAPAAAGRSSRFSPEAGAGPADPSGPPAPPPELPAGPPDGPPPDRIVVGDGRRGGPPGVVKVRAKRDPLAVAAAKDAVESGAAVPTSIRRQARTAEVYDKRHLTAMSTGLLSEALGPLYGRFDDGSFVARLPRAPFDFIDEAAVRRGRLGSVSVGTQVEAGYYLDACPGGERDWLLSEAGGLTPVVPYAAVNEMALQPCGFLAAYMGSALQFPGPMHFRNLGGHARMLGNIGKLKGMVQTKATLTKSSVLGSMAIQHYSFQCFWNGEPLYEGETHFGFHSPESVARPPGLKANPALLKALTAPAAQAPGRPYPVGPAFPSGRWRMIDTVVTDVRGDGRVWGRAKVDAKAWFFQAHFPGDPVWPGSLGLEGFLQCAKVLAAEMTGKDPASLTTSWLAPLGGVTHRWLYRGQIIPFNKDVTFGLKVVHNEQHTGTLTLKGLLWVDNRVVYQVDDFAVRFK